MKKLIFGNDQCKIITIGILYIIKLRFISKENFHEIVRLKLKKLVFKF